MISRYLKKEVEHIIFLQSEWLEMDDQRVTKKFILIYFNLFLFN